MEENLFEPMVINFSDFYDTTLTHGEMQDLMDGYAFNNVLSSKFSSFPASESMYDNNYSNTTFDYER